MHRKALNDPTYTGPPIDDFEVLVRLPVQLQRLLEDVNGFIQYDGGLHVRGACFGPEWHSLREVWVGRYAIHGMYDDVRESDIPFAQNCVGDQFLLRADTIMRLDAEDGELTSTGMTINEFLAAVQADPFELLDLQALSDFHERAGQLAPGELVLAYPPLCTEESEDSLSLRAAPVSDVIRFHAQLAAHISKLARGAAFTIQVTD